MGYFKNQLIKMIEIGFTNSTIEKLLKHTKQGGKIKMKINLPLEVEIIKRPDNYWEIRTTKIIECIWCGYEQEKPITLATLSTQELSQLLSPEQKKLLGL